MEGKLQEEAGSFGLDAAKKKKKFTQLFLPCDTALGGSTFFDRPTCNSLMFMIPIYLGTIDLLPPIHLFTLAQSLSLLEGLSLIPVYP